MRSNNIFNIYDERIPILAAYAAIELSFKEDGKKRKYKAIKELKNIFEKTIDEVCRIQKNTKQTEPNRSLETLKEVLEETNYEYKSNPNLGKTENLYLFHGLSELNQKLSNFLKFGPIFPDDVNKLTEFCTKLSTAAKVNSIATLPQKYTLNLYL